MMFTSISMSTFLPTYFQRVQGFPLQKATLLASGIMLTAIVGSPLGGWIADAWMKRRIQARLLLPAISAFLTAALFLAGFYLPPGGFIQYGIFLLAGIASIAWASSAIAVTQDVVHPGLRAVSYALCVVTQNLLGSALGPVVTGAFSDRYGILTALKIASSMAIYLLCPLLPRIALLSEGPGEGREGRPGPGKRKQASSPPVSLNRDRPRESRQNILDRQEASSYPRLTLK